MGNKKVGKFSMAALVALGVVVVSLIVVIVGYVLAWTKTSMGSLSQTTKLSELAKAYKEGGELSKTMMKGFGAMNAFAIITLIAVILSGVALAAGSVLDVKIVKLVAAVIGIVTVVCAVVLLITTFIFCGNMKDVTGGLGDLAQVKVSPAIGPWLMTIFGVIGGGATAVGALKA